MQQLSYRGGGALAIDEVTPGPPPAGRVRVRVHSTGLCTSDVYGCSGVNDRRDAVLAPGDVLVMGHEIAGTVEAAGPGACAPLVGTPVAVNPIFGCGACARCAAGEDHLCASRTVVGCTPAAPGGFAELVDVPARCLHVLPASLSLEWGALVEPLSVGAHGVALAELEPTDSVLVVGGGIIGLGAALAARRSVGDRVLVLEPLPERRALARRLGLDAAAPETVLGGDRRFDVALDCVARPETFAGAIDAVGARGLVVLVGIWADEIPLPVSVVVGQETRIMGSYGYSQADFAGVVAWAAGGEVELSPLIEHRVGFDGVIEAFASSADGSLGAVRTLFQPAATKE